MKKVKTEEAVGMILCHDLTQIIPGKFKGVAFKKGHIIQKDDISKLLEMGKDHVYVWENEAGLLHEDEAGKRLAQALNKGGFDECGPKEGKVDLLAKTDGLLRINQDVLTRINMLGEVVISTLPDYSHVSQGEKVAGMRVIPLAVKEEKIHLAENIAAAAPWTLEVKPFQIKKAGMIVTGNEVYYGRIEDKFGPKVQAKLEKLGVELAAKACLPDSAEKISTEILKQAERGLNLILISGGMSVDPDDVTPTAIRATGAKVITYGTPIFPGAMFMLAYLNDVPVLGLPGCVMHSPATVFDKFLPRILAGESISFEQIAASGVGGLCRDCDSCHFPNCSFGTI